MIVKFKIKRIMNMIKIRISKMIIVINKIKLKWISKNKLNLISFIWVSNKTIAQNIIILYKLMNNKETLIHKI